MRNGTKLIIVAVMWLVVVPAITVLSVKYGSPQAVWFYCDILGWCRP